jgi:hypothetical protein
MAKRIGLWIASVVSSVTISSLLIGLLQGNISTVPIILKVIMLFALPVSCLYLPLVILLKDAGQRRTWMLLMAGAVIGPLTIAGGALISQLRGGNVSAIWNGDPLTGVGAGAGMIFASIEGVLTTVIYVIALKSATRRSDGA